MRKRSHWVTGYPGIESELQQALLVPRYPTPLYSSGARKGGPAGSAKDVAGPNQ